MLQFCNLYPGNGTCRLKSSFCHQQRQLWHCERCRFPSLRISWERQGPGCPCVIHYCVTTPATWQSQLHFGICMIEKTVIGCDPKWTCAGWQNPPEINSTSACRQSRTECISQIFASFFKKKRNQNKSSMSNWWRRNDNLCFGLLRVLPVSHLDRLSGQWLHEIIPSYNFSDLPRMSY